MYDGSFVISDTHCLMQASLPSMVVPHNVPTHQCHSNMMQKPTLSACVNVVASPHLQQQWPYNQPCNQLIKQQAACTCVEFPTTWVVFSDVMTGICKLLHICRTSLQFLHLMMLSNYHVHGFVYNKREFSYRTIVDVRP